MTDFRNWLLRYAGLYIGIAAGLIVLILFLGQDIATRAAQIRSQRQTLASRLGAFESLTALQVGSREARQISAELEKSLPEKDELIAFLPVLENFAKNNQLRIEQRLKFESEIPGEGMAPNSHSFIIGARGSYANFVRFLRNIEESGYFVSFSMIDLAQRDTDFEMRMNGRVFSR
jgi:Tfp pilus assembly protein PilO